MGGEPTLLPRSVDLGAQASSNKRVHLTRFRNANRGVFHALASKSGFPDPRDTAQAEAGWNLLLPEIPSTIDRSAMAQWRGRLDAAALRARLSDRAIHDSFQPSGNKAQTLFNLLEQNRVEALGARIYAGVRANLAELAHERWVRARPEAVIRGPISGWIETFALLSRIPLTAPMPESTLSSLKIAWRDWMTPRQAVALTTLGEFISDQESFAAQALRIVGELLDETQKARHENPCGAPEEQIGDQPVERAGQAEGTLAGTGASDSNVAIDKGPDTADSATGSEPYRIYTKAYDSIVEARDLFPADVMSRRRSELDRRVRHLLPGISRWAHRLQRKLLDLQMRSWQFDREEGEIDAGRLIRVVTRPLEPLVFKQESEVEFPETVVTLLIDNSGSMRGLPIATAAACTELLGRAMERCAVKCEILGFTTRSWRGGRAFQDWTAAGREKTPGRLAELRHVIYKSADQPWRRASAGLGVMLEDGLLKENIDGEALLWAHHRLLRRSESRKIMLVISDGAPRDDVTLEANDAGYLDRHLRRVIDSIERRAAIELVAIGIGHDVRAYYRRAVAIRSAEELSEAIVTQLIDLFDRPGADARGAPAARQRAAGNLSRGVPR